MELSKLKEDFGILTIPLTTKAWRWSELNLRPNDFSVNFHLREINIFCQHEDQRQNILESIKSL